MKKGMGCISLSALLLLAPSSPRAEILRATSLVLEVPRLSALSMRGDVSGLLTLAVDASAETAYDQGYVQSDPNATILSISTNDAWDLSARISADWTCPGSYDKNESDLFIRISNRPTGTIKNGADSYINLSAGDLTILMHPSPVTNQPVEIQTRVALAWTKDIPGSYSIPVTYTLVTHIP